MRLAATLFALLLCATLVPTTALADHHGTHDAAAAVVEQSIPADADTGTCGGGGQCCSACQVRKKYAKAPADAGGGCPCQRAKKAREAARALKN